MTRFACHFSLLALCLLLGSGCGKSKASTGTRAGPTSMPATTTLAVSPPDPAADAQRVFRSKCSVCHGAQGNGDGAGAAALTPKPRAFSDAQWQAKVTDDQIKKTILEGGPAVGLSAGMPASMELRGKDVVVAELTKLIRGFKR